MKTNLQGRLKNTSLPKTHGLLPIFEAVVNSIHSIEEAGISTVDGYINIEVLRSNQEQLSFDNKNINTEEITGFNITDNGIGFNTTNFESFQTFDTQHKAAKGGRGIGRLLWLKAFTIVNIRSVFYEQDSQSKLRVFDFTADKGITNLHENVISEQRKTSVKLTGLKKCYQKTIRKAAKSIANDLLEHCLWYFVRSGGAPRITIQDKDEVINLDQIYEEYIFKNLVLDSFELKGHEFQLIHIKTRVSYSQKNTIAFCSANRLVKKENIAGFIPGLFSRLQNETEEFTYSCYISSTYLDERVTAERTSFNIEENDMDSLFEENELSFEDIRKRVLEQVAKFLKSYLEKSITKSRQRVQDFVSTKAPKYRPILKHIPENDLLIDPDASDKELDSHLHKHLFILENQILVEGHDLMKPNIDEDFTQYKDRLNDYLQKITDIKKSDLANYITHRKIIIDLLEKSIHIQEDSKYVRESLIHNLIMPRFKDSTDIFQDSCNLWIIDERLAFHDYLASDKPISSMPVTDSEDNKKPDIFCLNICDNPILVSESQQLPLSSIIVIEIKKPMRDDAKEGEDKNPIEQALGYLKRIRQGIVQTSKGRIIPPSESIPGFCYIISDLTPTMIDRCDLATLKVTSDNLGYFGFNPNYNAYIEVISYDRLLNMVKERNRAFFDRLGLPTT